MHISARPKIYAGLQSAYVENPEYGSLLCFQTFSWIPIYRQSLEGTLKHDNGEENAWVFNKCNEIALIKNILQHPLVAPETHKNISEHLMCVKSRATIASTHCRRDDPTACH